MKTCEAPEECAQYRKTFARHSLNRGLCVNAYKNAMNTKKKKKRSRNKTSDRYRILESGMMGNVRENGHMGSKKGLEV